MGSSTIRSRALDASHQAAPHRFDFDRDRGKLRSAPMSLVNWLAGLWSATLLGALASASCSAPPAIEQCFLPGDEDGNGLADCADSACWRANGDCKELCDGKTDDEDGDGKADCSDSDCWVKGGECQEVCSGGHDEDADGATDCDDDECWTEENACPEQCTGGHDEDADGATDCDDDECWTEENACPEQCTGGHDEDADGATDCDDSDCAADPACAPSFETDAKPVLLKHCAGQVCHVDGIGAGGMVVSKYEDMLKPAIYCQGANKGACCAYRMKEGSMPKNCSGCVPQADIDVIQAWVDGGLQP
jgi:hypothetical protein